MMDNRKEIYKSFPEHISLKQTEKIIEQMKSNSICRINNKETGFFVKIPYKSKLLPVLITTNHAINIYDILCNRNISLHLNNEQTIKTITLDNSRLMYTNAKFDISIIEIKEEDNLKNKYLELDDEIINFLKLDKTKLKKKEVPNYLYESIYILNSSKNKDIFISFGKLQDINNNEIFHKCNLKEDSSGSPICLMNNQKLIGIQSENDKQNKDNKGLLLI